MKKRIFPIFIIVLLILFIIAGFVGMRLVDKYTPSKELADVGGLFNVSNDEVALILNEELQDVKGLYVEEQTYLPVTWVNEHLNEKFYWDSIEKLLVYALPDTVVYADSQTIGNSGKPLLWVTEEETYLSLGLVANYTDVRMTAYDGLNVKRIYIDSNWTEEHTAMIEKPGKVRVLGGIKSPIVTLAPKDSKVKILNGMDDWSYIRTEDGYLGYVQNKILGEIHNETPVSSFVAPVYKNQSMGEKVSLVWHQVTNMEANESMEKLMSNTKGVNVISPTWFALTDNSGGYKSLASKSYVKKAHDMGLQVWALLDNFSKNVQTEVLLAPTSNRKKLIASLMAEAEAFDLDGLNLDFEGIKETAGPHYVQFIRELSVACREKGIILSVDNYVPSSYTEFYNRTEQGIVADYVIIMGYDEHYAGGEMGSVSSIDYVKKGIEDTLKVVDKEKVINAIPLYTRVWKEEDGKTSSTAMGIAKAKAWVEDNNVELYWQEELGQYYGDMNSDVGKQYIWMEEEKSIGLKMDLIRDNDLAGVACWKLGFEPSNLWDVINQ